MTSKKYPKELRSPAICVVTGAVKQNAYESCGAFGVAWFNLRGNPLFYEQYTMEKHYNDENYHKTMARVFKDAFLRIRYLESNISGAPVPHIYTLFPKPTDPTKRSDAIRKATDAVLVKLAKERGSRLTRRNFDHVIEFITGDEESEAFGMVDCMRQAGFDVSHHDKLKLKALALLMYEHKSLWAHLNNREEQND